MIGSAVRVPALIAIVALVGCADRVIGVQWPAQYDMTHFLDRPLPAIYGMRVIADSDGNTIECVDSLRGSRLGFNSDGEVAQRWLGDTSCSDGRAPVTFDRLVYGEARQAGQRVLINWPYQSSLSVDTLLVEGDKLVQELKIPRSSESDPDGSSAIVDTLHMRYRRAAGK